MHTLPRQVTTQPPGSCDPMNDARHSRALQQGRGTRLEAGTTHGCLSPRTEPAHTTPPTQRATAWPGRPAGGPVSVTPRKGLSGMTVPSPAQPHLPSPRLAPPTSSPPALDCGDVGPPQRGPSPTAEGRGLPGCPAGAGQAAGHPAWPGARPRPQQTCGHRLAGLQEPWRGADFR